MPRLALIKSLATYRVDHWRKWREARLLAGRCFPEPWQQPVRDRAVNVVGAVSGASYLAMATALERWSATDRLDQLCSRILLIAAEHDVTPLAEKRALAARTGASLVVVRNSRHGTPFDSIEVTNGCLVAHLNDQPLPGRDTWVRDERANMPAWLLAAGIAEDHAVRGIA